MIAKDTSRWAREVVESYLRAGSGDDARAWLSQDYRRRVEKETAPVYFGFKAWCITAEELAPGQDEALFKVTAADGKLTIRVIKEKDLGRWRVDHVQYTEKAAVKPDGKP